MYAVLPSLTIRRLKGGEQRMPSDHSGSVRSATIVTGKWFSFAVAMIEEVWLVASWAEEDDGLGRL